MPRLSSSVLAMSKELTRRLVYSDSSSNSSPEIIEKLNTLSLIILLEKNIAKSSDGG